MNSIGKKSYDYDEAKIIVKSEYRPKSGKRDLAPCYVPTAKTKQQESNVWHQMESHSCAFTPLYLWPSVPRQHVCLDGESSVNVTLTRNDPDGAYYQARCRTSETTSERVVSNPAFNEVETWTLVSNDRQPVANITWLPTNHRGKGKYCIRCDRGKVFQNT